MEADVALEAAVALLAADEVAKGLRLNLKVFLVTKAREDDLHLRC